MALSLLSIALLSTSALAAPRPEVEVVQVRQVSKRQDPSSLDLGDLSSLLPTDLGDLSSLLPTDLGDLNSLLPTDLGDLSTLLPTSLDLSSLSQYLAPTILPSGCMPPSDLANPPTPGPEVMSVFATWTDYCAEPSLSGEAGAQYTSYQDALSSWVEEKGPEISSYAQDFLSNCPFASDYASLVPTDSAGLNSLLGNLAMGTCGSSSRGSATARPTGSTTTTRGSTQGSATESGEEPTDTAASATGASGTPGAAPQQTAFVAAAGVVAGIAGLVAVL